MRKASLAIIALYTLFHFASCKKRDSTTVPDNNPNVGADSFKVKGTFFYECGQPLKNAAVSLHYLVLNTGEKSIAATGTTDSIGRFSFTAKVPKSLAAISFYSDSQPKFDLELTFFHPEGGKSYDLGNYYNSYSFYSIVKLSPSFTGPIMHDSLYIGSGPGDYSVAFFQPNTTWLSSVTYWKFGGSGPMPDTTIHEQRSYWGWTKREFDSAYNLNISGSNPLSQYHLIRIRSKVCEQDTLFLKIP